MPPFPASHRVWGGGSGGFWTLYSFVRSWTPGTFVGGLGQLPPLCSSNSECLPSVDRLLTQDLPSQHLHFHGRPRWPLTLSAHFPIPTLFSNFLAPSLRTRGGSSHVLPGSPWWQCGILPSASMWGPVGPMPAHGGRDWQHVAASVRAWVATSALCGSLLRCLSHHLAVLRVPWGWQDTAFHCSEPFHSCNEHSLVPLFCCHVRLWHHPPPSGWRVCQEKRAGKISTL